MNIEVPILSFVLPWILCLAWAAITFTWWQKAKKFKALYEAEEKKALDWRSQFTSVRGEFMRFLQLVVEENRIRDA